MKRKSKAPKRYGHTSSPIVVKKRKLNTKGKTFNLTINKKKVDDVEYSQKLRKTILHGIKKIRQNLIDDDPIKQGSGNDNVLNRMPNVNNDSINNNIDDVDAIIKELGPGKMVDIELNMVKTKIDYELAIDILEESKLIRKIFRQHKIASDLAYKKKNEIINKLFKSKTSCKQYVRRRKSYPEIHKTADHECCYVADYEDYPELYIPKFKAPTESTKPYKFKSIYSELHRRESIYQE